MKVTHVKTDAIYHSDLVITDYDSNINNWDVKVTLETRKKSAGTKDYLIKVSVDVLRNKINKIASIKISTEFGVISDSPNFQPLNEFDYYFYADLIKTSIDHARVILYQQTKDTEVSGGYMTTEPIHKYADDVKSGRAPFLN